MFYGGNQKSLPDGTGGNKSETIVSVWDYHVCNLLGEFLHCLIPLPIPASIYGLLLMLAGLMTKVIKLEQVKIAADFLIEIMPPMFIPAAVGLIVTWSDLKAILVPVLVITCITTVFVMVVTGRTAQAVMHLKENMAAQKMEKQD